MEDKEFNLYVLAEMKYKKENANKENIFPKNWYSFKNYKLKIEIIVEALKNNILIEETEIYKKNFSNGCLRIS